MNFARKLVIVEDDALLRGLLLTQFSSWGFDVREVSTATEAVAVCKEFDPDGVVLDVDLGAGLNGFQLAEALGRQFPHLGMVFLTRFPDARASISRMSPALQNAAYVNKSAIHNTNDLLRAINAALSDSGEDIRNQATPANPLGNLTALQLEVLKMMHEGKTNAQIASERATSLSAVDNMVSRIFKTIHVDGGEGNPRARAVRMYAESYGYRSQ